MLNKEQCLKGNFLFSVSFSEGIAMDEFRYNRKDYGLFPIYQEFVFKIWDFGGQEDFYTTHQCFLSTLALYLLVWNLEEGKTCSTVTLSFILYHTIKFISYNKSILLSV